MPVRACAILGVKAVKRLVRAPACYAEGVKEEMGRRDSVSIETPTAHEVP